MRIHLRLPAVLGLVFLCLPAGVRAADAPQPALDRHGFPLPAGAAARLGSIAFHHECRITALACAPDGKQFASGGADGVIRFWDAATGRELRRLSGHTLAVVTLVFSPDGKRLASGEALIQGNAPEVPPAAHGVVKLWDVAAGKELHSFGGNGNPPAEFVKPLAAFAPDGKLLATRGTEDGTLTVWDTATGKQALTLDDVPSPVRAVAFVQFGKQLALVGDGPAEGDDKSAGGLAFWDVASGRRRRVLAGPEDATLAAFAPDGKLLATFGEDRAVRLWEVASGKVRQEIKARGKHAAAAADLVFSPDGRFLAVRGIDLKVRLWDLLGQKQELTITIGTPPRKVTFPGGLPFAAQAPPGDAGPPVPLAFTPDGKTLLVGGDTQVIRFWDLTTGRERLPADGHRGAVGAVAVSPDGKRIATGGVDRTIRLWDAATGKEHQQLRGHGGAVTFLTFSPDGKLLASGSATQDEVRVWDVVSGKELSRLPLSGAAELVQLGRQYEAFLPAPMRQQLSQLESDARCFFLPDGKTLVARRPFSDDKATGAALVFWDATTGKELRTIEVVRLSPFARGVGDPAKAEAQPMLSNPATGFSLPQMIYQVNFPFTLSADGKTLATAAPEAITLWDTATGKQLRWFPVEAPPALLAFAPNGETLAAVAVRPDLADGFGVFSAFPIGFGNAGLPTPEIAEDDGGVITLYETAGGTELHTLEGHEGPIAALAFAPDGTRLASVGRDRLLRLWDVAGGKPLRPVAGHLGAVGAAAFAPDGAALVTGSDDGTALVWKTADLLRAVGTVVPVKRDDLWAALGSDDAAKAGEAMKALAATPRETIALLGQHLKPLTADPEQVKRIAGWIADLESDKFPVREKAVQQLEKCGEPAEAALLKVLASQPTLETRLRVEQVLRALEERLQGPEHLRTLRTLEVLERLGTPAARQLLEKLAGGIAEGQLTREAKAALQRLGRRPGE